MENITNPYPNEFAKRLQMLVTLYCDSIHSFEKEVGVSLGSIQKPVKNGGTIGAEAISKILLKYPDFDVYYLLTATRKVEKEYNSKTETLNILKSIKQQAKQSTPEQNQQKIDKKIIELQEEIIDVLQENRELRKEINAIKSERREELAYQSV